MNIDEYCKKIENHPILFVGTGLSLRYLKHSYSWEGLLKEVTLSYGSEEHFLDLKNQMSNDSFCDYPRLASTIEKEFNEYLSREDQRTGRFKSINDRFYQAMRDGHQASRFKIYLSELLSNFECNSSMTEEMNEFRAAKKNIASVVTTNYDELIERTFNFQPLVGNDILLSNPYGSVYKIHGTVTDPNSIIISYEDYEKFNYKYELIRAELLSLFVHHPIIFLGYSLSDENVVSILNTIFSYVEYGSELADRIRDNFLLVEYDQNLEDNVEITDFVIRIDSGSNHMIKINRLSTNNFSAVYNALAALTLPVSVMDIRKVSNIVREIESGGKIKVDVVGDVESLPNSEKILFIGSKDEIKYVIAKTSTFLFDYFKLLSLSEVSRIKLIDQTPIQSTQWFPIFGFSRIYSKLEKYEQLKQQQIDKLITVVEKVNKKKYQKKRYEDVNDVLNDDSINKSDKVNALVLAILEDRIPLENVQMYLENYSGTRTTDFKKLLCAYDYQKYSPDKGYISTI